MRVFNECSVVKTILFRVRVKLGLRLQRHFKPFKIFMGIKLFLVQQCSGGMNRFRLNECMASVQKQTSLGQLNSGEQK